MFLIKKHPFLCKKCDLDPILENWKRSSHWHYLFIL